MKKRIEGRTYDAEAALQGLSNTALYDCIFAGPGEGEYALKDAREITMENCHFSLRYPLWNVQKFKMTDSRLGVHALSPIHGCENGKILDSDIKSPCAVRECKKILIHDCSILAPEFGWNCDELTVEESNIHADAVLRECRHLRLDDVEIRGSDALQNAEHVHICNTFLNSDNALKNSKHVTIVDSVLHGDFLCWNCENITLIGCRIHGMQPLCHCRNAKLVNCTMDGCELAFEYSDVKANIAGHLNSVKNPLSGQITADAIGHVIIDDENLNSTAEILVRG